MLIDVNMTGIEWTRVFSLRRTYKKSQIKEKVVGNYVNES